MNSILFSFLAAGCAASSNLIFRQSNSHQNFNGYLLFFYLLSFLFSLLWTPSLWILPVNPWVLAVGATVGILNIALMTCTSRALTVGPAGLTFAIHNASAVFPGILLFSCSFTQFLGMILVLIGLYLGAKDNSTPLKGWVKYALACFIIQICALTLIQARCMFFSHADDIWFMPGQFGAALIFQTLLFLTDGRSLRRNEIIFGSSSGLTNFASTALLLLATRNALPFEKSILFPCFAVATLFLCNLWANRLYQEKFHLPSNIMCGLGIFCGVLY